MAGSVSASGLCLPDQLVYVPGIVWQALQVPGSYHAAAGSQHVSYQHTLLHHVELPAMVILPGNHGLHHGLPPSLPFLQARAHYPTPSICHRTPQSQPLLAHRQAQPVHEPQHGHLGILQPFAELHHSECPTSLGLGSSTWTPRAKAQCQVFPQTPRRAHQPLQPGTIAGR